MDDIKEKVWYDDSTRTMNRVMTQDVEPYLIQNAELRAKRTGPGKYKGAMVLAASIPMNVVEMMRLGQCCTDGKRYNLMSTDFDERRRALVHVQTEHKALLTVDGTPFAKKRVKWQ